MSDDLENEISISEKVLFIRISQLYRPNMNEEELYEATCGVWKIGTRRDNADYALCVAKGMVQEVYKIDYWLVAGNHNYKTRHIDKENSSNRWEFTGTVAEDSIRNKYVGKSVKDYFKKGESNPIKYYNC